MLLSRPRSSLPAISRSRISNSWLVCVAQPASDNRTTFARIRRMRVPHATMREAALRCPRRSRALKALDFRTRTDDGAGLKQGVGGEGALRGLVFVICALLLVLGPFQRT